MCVNTHINEEKWRLRTCCCGCTIRVGTQIIGILEFLSSVSQIIAAQYEDVNYFYSTDEYGYSTNGTVQVKNPYYAGQLASGIVCLLVSAALLWGSYKNQKVFLLPWLIIRGISNILLMVLIIIVFVLTFVTGVYLLLVMVLVLIILTALSLYFWRCVWSYYKELAQQERNPVSIDPTFGQSAPISYEQSQQLHYGQMNYGQPGPINYGQPGPVNYGQPGPVNYGEPGPINYAQPGPVSYGSPDQVNYGQPDQKKYEESLPMKS